MFCTVHYNIIIQCKPPKNTFYKLIFSFLMSSTCIEPEGTIHVEDIWN